VGDEARKKAASVGWRFSCYVNANVRANSYRRVMDRNRSSGDGAVLAGYAYGSVPSPI
jgi:hypothetical protein